MEFKQARALRAPSINRMASALANPSRESIIEILMDGRAYTLLEISQRLPITPQTVSYHLRQLMSANFVSQIKSGRHHYYRLVSIDLAHLFEELSLTAPKNPEHRLSHRGKADNMTFCRTCYDHLAGTVAVKLLHAFERRSFIQEQSGNRLIMLPEGKAFFEREFKTNTLNVDRAKRQLTVACLDWSERDYHLGGSWGHALFEGLQKQRYLQKESTSRVVIMTPLGNSWFAEKFGFNFNRKL